MPERKEGRATIAICPAGPPKLMKPGLRQKRKASANEMDWMGAEGAGCASGKAVSTDSSVMSRQRLDGTPSNFAEREAVFPVARS